MRVQFVEKANGPERLVCDAEILFDEGPLAGMKLVGFSVWRGAEGDVYVTFPSRAFGTATERKYLRLPAGHRARRRRGPQGQGLDAGGVPDRAGRVVDLGGALAAPPIIPVRRSRPRPRPRARASRRCPVARPLPLLPFPLLPFPCDPFLIVNSLAVIVALAAPAPPPRPPRVRTGPRPTTTSASPSSRGWPATCDEAARRVPQGGPHRSGVGRPAHRARADAARVRAHRGSAGGGGSGGAIDPADADVHLVLAQVLQSQAEGDRERGRAEEGGRRLRAGAAPAARRRRHRAHPRPPLRPARPARRCRAHVGALPRVRSRAASTATSSSARTSSPAASPRRRAAALQKALVLQPDSARAYHALGEIYATRPADRPGDPQLPQGARAGAEERRGARDASARCCSAPGATRRRSRRRMRSSPPIRRTATRSTCRRARSASLRQFDRRDRGHRPPAEDRPRRPEGGVPRGDRGRGAARLRGRGDAPREDPGPQPDAARPTEPATTACSSSTSAWPTSSSAATASRPTPSAARPPSAATPIPRCSASRSTRCCWPRTRTPRWPRCARRAPGIPTTAT